MPVWLDTTGNSNIAIGVCDRCHQKFAIVDLLPDYNSPGLRVCRADQDTLDPYRLPARQTESILVPYPRPDVDIATNPPPDVPRPALATEDEKVITTDDGQGLLVQP